jgi:hypothetical protein
MALLTTGSRPRLQISRPLWGLGGAAVAVEPVPRSSHRGRFSPNPPSPFSALKAVAFV